MTADKADLERIQTENGSQKWVSQPFRFYLKRSKKLVFKGQLSLLATNFFDVLPPLLIGLAIDRLVAGAPWQDLLPLALGLLGVALALSVFRYLWRIYWGNFSHDSANHLRKRLFAHLMKMGPQFYQKKGVGDLMSLMTQDVNGFRMGLGPGLLITADAVILLVLIPPIMIYLSWEWTYQTTFFLFLVPFIVYFLLKQLFKGFSRRQKSFAELSSSVQELIMGIRVVKSFDQKLRRSELFEGPSQDFKKSAIEVEKWAAGFAPSLYLMSSLGSFLLIWWGAPSVIAEEVTIGAFFAFHQYLVRLTWPMEALGIGFGHLQESKASFSRIREVLLTPPEWKNEGLVSVDRFDSLEFRNVSFCYPTTESPVFEDLNFRLEAGQTLAVCGLTGSGKSTLIHLMTRSYEPTEGQIFLNGQPIESWERTSLLSLFAVAPQENFVFSQSVTENLSFGLAEPDPEKVKGALSWVQLSSEMDTLPDGIETKLGERGSNLSGGQVQRLSLGRALISPAPVLLLDDTLSAVDAQTEFQILSHLRKVQYEESEKTVLFISQRLESFKEADKILVLASGGQEALGTHQKVYDQSETYRRILDLQQAAHQ